MLPASGLPPLRGFQRLRRPARAHSGEPHILRAAMLPAAFVPTGCCRAANTLHTSQQPCTHAAHICLLPNLLYCACRTTSTTAADIFRGTLAHITPVITATIHSCLPSLLLQYSVAGGQDVCYSGRGLTYYLTATTRHIPALPACPFQWIWVELTVGWDGSDGMTW